MVSNHPLSVSVWICSCFSVSVSLCLSSFCSPITRHSEPSRGFYFPLKKSPGSSLWPTSLTTTAPRAERPHLLSLTPRSTHWALSYLPASALDLVPPLSGTAHIFILSLLQSRLHWPACVKCHSLPTHRPFLLGFSYEHLAYCVCVLLNYLAYLVSPIGMLSPKDRDLSLLFTAVSPMSTTVPATQQTHSKCLLNKSPSSSVLWFPALLMTTPPSPHPPVPLCIPLPT